MKQITIWRSLVCDCIVNFEWDDSLPREERIHTLVSHGNCPIHQSARLGAQWHANVGTYWRDGHEMDWLVDVQKSSDSHGVLTGKIRTDLESQLPPELLAAIPILEKLGFSRKPPELVIPILNNDRSHTLKIIHPVSDEHHQSLITHLDSHGHSDVEVVNG